MRLGLIIYGSLKQNSGGYRYDRTLVTHLRQQGHQVKLIPLPWRSSLAHLADNFSTPLISKIKTLHLDILLQDELNHPSLFLLNRRLKAQLSVPIISIVHHLRSSEEHPVLLKSIYGAMERRYLNSVDGFIFNSKTTRDVVTSLLDHAKPGVVALPGGDRLAPQITLAEIRQRARQSGPLRVLFLGNLIHRKAPQLLLEAAAVLPPGSVQLTFAGGARSEPGYAAFLKKLVKQYGLGSQVEFCGHLADKELRARMRSSQVLAVPSSYEGFGIAYVEGMGFGLPAIGTRAGAAPELIRPGRTGYLIDAGNARQLALILERLNADRALLARLGVAARKQWAKHPTWEQTLAGIEDFLSHYNHATSRLAYRWRKQ